MKTIQIFLSFIVLQLIHLQSWSQAQPSTEAKKMTLKECVDFAISNNNTIKNNLLDEKIAEQKVREVLGIGLPQLSGSMDVKDYVQIPTSLIPGEVFGAPAGSFIPVQFGTQWNATAGLSASQIIFSGSYLLGLKASREYMKLSKKSTAVNKIGTAEQVTKAYYGVIVNKERAKLLDVNLVRLEKTFKDTKAYQQQGFVEQLDVDRLEVALANLKVEKEKVDKLMDISMYLLKFQMGMQMNQNLQLADSISATTLAQTETIDFDPNQRLEMSLLQTTKSLYELDVRAKKAEYMPSLAAYGVLQTSAMRTEFDIFDTKKPWFSTGIIGITLNVPIFNGMQTDARIKQSKLTLEKSKNDLNNLTQVIDFQVKSNFIAYENAIKSLTIQKRSMDLAQEVVRVTSLKQKEGVGSNFEVVTAEAELRTAQINYFESLYNALISKIDLQKAKGTLIQP